MGKDTLENKFPHIASQWDSTKNSVYPKDVKPFSNKKAWFLCEKKHSYETVISRRTMRNTGCPYCTSRKVGYGNDLETNFPLIADEWDSEKNKLKPNQVTPYANKSVWWICSNNHSYESKIANRTFQNKGCPFCSGRLPTSQYNLQTEFPVLCEEWDYDKNKLTPKSYLPHSSKKVWWLCSKKHSFQQVINLRTNGQNCPKCYMPNRSREEIYLLFELKKFFQIDEDNQRIKVSNKSLDVDIIIQDLNLVIEYDGAYFHKKKFKKDKEKTELLTKNNWNVIRVRERPLKLIDNKFDIQVDSQDYKITANKTLSKINERICIVSGLDKYLKQDSLLNKKNADLYIRNVLKFNLSYEEKKLVEAKLKRNKTCLNCSKSYIDNYRMNNSIYCSDVCKNEVKEKAHKSTRFCEVCDSKFSFNKYQNPNQRFCSLKCSSKNQTKPLSRIICKNCNKEFFKRLAPSRIGRTKYCSKECQFESMKKKT